MDGRDTPGHDGWGSWVPVFAFRETGMTALLKWPSGASRAISLV
jgi:hypothetical protein